MPRRWTNLTIRGVTYPTAADAAAALGITVSAVFMAAKKGQEGLDRCGLRLHHPRPCPVRIGGVVYPTVPLAAAALGLKTSRIYQALAAGDVDRVLRPPPPCLVRAVPLIVSGRHFPSHSALDRWIGMAEGYSARAIKRGGSARARLFERVLAKAMAEEIARGAAA